MSKVQSKRTLKTRKMRKKNYIILYLISIGISITNNIQTGWALSTGRFIELNLLGYNWIIILLTVLFYLVLLIPFLINDKTYMRVFSFGIIFLIFLGFGVFIHDIMIIKGFI